MSQISLFYYLYTNTLVMNYEEINKAYEDLIQPTKLISYFKTDQQFAEWLFMGELIDLHLTLKAFEEEELYSYCCIIRDVIRYKESNC